MYRFINLIILSFLLSMAALRAECTDFGYTVSADLVSLYNFRGIDYGNSPAIQPYVGISYSNIEFFIWGSQALTAREKYEGETVPFNEIDWGLKYEIFTPIGKFTPGITLYYCPFENKKFFNLKGVKDGEAQGSQTINAQLAYYLSDDFPLQFIIDYNFYNNPQNPLYIGASYYVVHNDTYTLEPFLGIAKGTGAGGITDMYSTEKNQFTLVNAGFNLTKNIKINDNFKLPVTGTLAVQPHTEKVWFVLKIAI